YQQAQQTTPWNNLDCLAANIAYYLPLNYIRNRKVFDEVQHVGFPSNATWLLDYGAGLGPSYQAWQDSGTLSNLKYTAIDQSPKALDFFKTHFLQKNFPIWSPDHAAQTCAVFSYSLNELTQLPRWFFDLKEIIIVEPSTGQKGRQLMQLREQLIQKGYFIWAPCTHQQDCPLLVQSKKDWCHDRVHWQAPDWFLQTEKLLPIKNNTLTFSYLLASRSRPPSVENKGRIVGDPLKEKGKTRWLYCQNSERNFLSWLDKQGTTPDWQRGELHQFENLEKKGNELRIKPS
ncbi:small ribosomal subunit Rsm22 family protein, partial [bacterium]|nr:small ribosomal subunit Rsm22 family protein [bacterium]